jgi:hypothetical protein
VNNSAAQIFMSTLNEEGAGGGSSIYALTINEYDDRDRKPFIFLQNDEAFLGWCEHF